MKHELRFDLRAEVLPGPIQLDAEGCLTAANGQALLKVLDRALTLEGCPRIIVNLCGLDHLDPHGLRALEDHIAAQAHDRTAPGHSLLEPRPRVSIQAPPMPRHCSTPEGAVSVGELMSPLGPTVAVTDAVGEAARALHAHGETVVIVDAAQRAVGMITESDLEAAARQDPAGWRHGCCEEFVRVEEGRVRPEDPVEGVVWAYQHGPIRPVLVLNGGEAVGIVHPSAVFQWCAEHLPAVLPELSQRAADQAAATQPS